MASHSLHSLAQDVRSRSSQLQCCAAPTIRLPLPPPSPTQYAHPAKPQGLAALPSPASQPIPPRCSRARPAGERAAHGAHASSSNSSKVLGHSRGIGISARRGYRVEGQGAIRGGAAGGSTRASGLPGHGRKGPPRTGGRRRRSCRGDSTACGRLATRTVWLVSCCCWGCDPHPGVGWFRASSLRPPSCCT